MIKLDNNVRYNDKSGKYDIVCPLCRFRFSAVLETGTQVTECPKEDFMGDAIDGCGGKFAINLETKVERYVTIYKLEEVR